MKIDLYWLLIGVIVVMFAGILIDIKVFNYEVAKAVSICLWEAGLTLIGIIIGRITKGE